MNSTLDYILKKYKLSYGRTMPVEIPDTDRESLAVLFNELGFKVGAEIGVEQGVYSDILCRNNLGLELYAIDAWKAYKGYRDHVSQRKLDGFYDKTKKLLSPYSAELIKGFSMDVVKGFEDESLDFVYIDGNHDFQNTTNDIVEWYKKVRKGGIISGHDYVHMKEHHALHVIEVLHGYTAAYKISPWFVLGREARIIGERRDRSRSWFWVKQ